MKLQFLFGHSSTYSSKNWQIKLEKANLPSVTPTSIQRVGYGGYGWLLTIASTIQLYKLIVDLYKHKEKIGSYTLSNTGECMLYPNGGVIDDYKIIIRTK